jgi:hypothetical protein
MRCARRCVGVTTATLAAVIGGLLLSATPALALYANPSSASFSTGAGPNALAVQQSNGDVYVVAEGKIEKFNQAGTPVNFSGLGTNKLSPGVASAVEGIAVDNAAGSPSKGDLYVADYGEGVVEKYNSATGALIVSIPAPETAVAIGVDTNGDMYVAGYHTGKVYGFSPEGLALHFDEPVLELGAETHPYNLAFNSEGDLYVSENVGGKGTLEFAPAGAVFNPAPIGKELAGAEGGSYGLAVDRETNHVFVDDYLSPAVQEYNEAGLRVGGAFAAGSSFGVAINEETRTVYVTNNATSTVETFLPIPAKTLTVLQPGSGTGTVTSAPSGIDCEASCSDEFKEGEEVTLTATPSPTSKFVGWTGCASTAGAICKVTLSANTTVSAEFIPRTEYALTVSDVGTGKGVVSSSPGTIDCGASCSEEFTIGTGVTLTPAPATGSEFRGWSGACSLAGACEVAIENETAVSAEFAQEPPAVLTGGFSGITPYTAEIAGTVNPNGAATSECEFEYGTTSAYGSLAGCASNPGEGTSPVAVSASLSGLEAGTIYHYRLLATNVGGSKQGADQTFKTVATPPTLGPAEVTAITQTAATITTPLNAQGLLTRWELQLGTSAGSLIYQASGSTSSSGAAPLAVSLQALSPGTTYYYKLIAVNADNQANPTETPEASFTTAPPPFNAGLATQSPGTPLLATPNIKFPTEATNTSTTPKKLTKAQKLKNALKACKKDKSKARRAACERQAHKRYVVNTNAKGKKHAGGKKHG